MKNIIKGSEPGKLISYRENNPQGTWDNCKKNKNRRKEIQQRLLDDQGGLCAYCEIDLKAGFDTEAADFRVEHFHPKSDTSSSHNWHLDWRNLLACCHGGSMPDIVDALNRFSSPDHSCDVPKDNENWDNIILNPLQITSFPPLFSFSRHTGSIHVHYEHCSAANISHIIAQKTIDKLRLDADRLKRLRKSILNKINDELRGMVSRGIDLQIAKETLAEAYLYKNNDGHWPAFFSTIRDYLGDAAEKQLNVIHYAG